jgi:hypothetical protein
MNGGKVLAGAVIAGILGLQLAANLTAIDWYWPFINYPMYSDAHYRGDVFRYYELRQQACRRALPPAPVGAGTLRLGRFRYLQMLEQIAGDTAQAAEFRVDLSRMARRYLEPPPCRLEVWERIVEIGPAGAHPERAEWRRAVAWPLVRPDSLIRTSEAAAR